jgi:hypothetical protein
VLVLRCLLRSLLNAHCTSSFPTYGIAGNRFLVTTAPQNDICPYCSTYPINAVSMVRDRIAAPTDYVCMKLYDP